MRYWVQFRDQIFVKCYGFLSFAKNMGQNIVKNISKSLSGKHGSGMLAMPQELLDHVKQSATDALKTSSKRAIRKTAEATGDLISNKPANLEQKIGLK